MAKVGRPTVFSIYGLIDPQSKCVRYIGYTSKSLDVRLKAHVYETYSKVKSHKTYWLKSLNKRGLTPEVILIDTCDTLEDALLLECLHISKHENLVNSTTGGESSKSVREDVKLKMSLNRKGKCVGADNPMFGRNRPDLAERNKKVDPLSIEKMRAKLTELYNTNEYKDILRKSQKRKQVCQMDREGNVIKTFDSLREAALYGFGRKEIMNVIKGVAKQHKGFLWKTAV